MNIIEQYRILNKSLLDVLQDTTTLESLEFEEPTHEIRLEDDSPVISERSHRLTNGVLVAHNLKDYDCKFYSIHLETNKKVWIDVLLHIDYSKVDLTKIEELA